MAKSPEAEKRLTTKDTKSTKGNKKATIGKKTTRRHASPVVGEITPEVFF